MSTTQTLETKTLIEAMESRAKEYRLLRDQFQELKTAFKDIVDLDDFKGKTADSVKGFYRAQIDVVNSWIDFIDLQEAFFKGIKGMADDEDLGGKTLVHLPFLESDLKNSESRARQMVDSQEQALEDIFSGISDLVSMEPNSTKQFDKHIDEATKKRKETKEKVENFDQTLLEFYEQSKYHENVIAGLISELYKASSQGGEVNPLYFNEEAYKKSDVHTAREEAKEITANYISWQDELERARELENRSFGEKTWDTICTFTGEVTGYYDMKRASTGVDPVTGQELTDGQRATAAALAAAGFIPFVGWAGRAAKGGHAIYKTSKTFSAADNVLNAYKTTEAFDILKTSERGLYGLASANGFSEFITGRDIFGNPISEEEQQAGFERALLLLPFKGKTANPVLGVRNDARVVSKSIGKGEQVLDKVKTYEQARNKALDIVGDIGPHSQPYTGTLKSSAGYGQVVGRQSADGKVRWRLDYDPSKGTHLNIEDFRHGKGGNARKVAIPFEGNEDTYKSLLKHLNR